MKHLPVLFEKYPKVRSWIYGILPPLGLLLAFYGKTSGEEWSLWVGLITATLPGGVAFTNRPTGPQVQAGLTEIQNAAIAQAIAMMLHTEDRPEAFPPEVEPPEGEIRYEGG